MKRFLHSVMRWLFIIPFILATLEIENTPAASEKISVAVLKFFNDSGRSQLDILELTLREKMVNELKRYAELHIIDSAVIMNRITKRNLDLRTSLATASKIQYIGGLVDADALIAGNFIIDGDSIIISTQIYDGKGGQAFRIYRYSGLMSQINLIIEQTAAGLLKEIFAWQQMGGFIDSNSMAHKLGKTVGHAEEEIALAQRIVSGAPPKIDIGKAFFDSAELLFTAKMTALSTISTQINHILRKTAAQSAWAEYYQWLFFIAGEYYYEQNNLERAQELWSYARLYVPNSPLIEYRIALFNLQQQNYAMAVTLYTRLIKRYPDKSTLYAGMANALIGQEDYDTAILFARRGLDISPKNKNLLIVLAHTYVRTNKVEQAVVTLKDGLVHFPNDPDIVKLISAYLKLMPTP